MIVKKIIINLKLNNKKEIKMNQNVKIMNYKVPKISNLNHLNHFQTTHLTSSKKELNHILLIREPI